MKYLVLLLIASCLLVAENQSFIYYASFDEGQTTCTHSASSLDEQKVTKVHSIIVSFSQEQIGRVDLKLNMGENVKEFVGILPGEHVIDYTLTTPANIHVETQAYAFVENAMVSVVVKAESAFDVNRAPKKPYGNLQLPVHKIQNGKSVSHVGAMNINHKGWFNAATYTAKTNGNVSIKVAAINANGATKEIALFNKKTKKGETYILNHKPLKSNGIFVVSTVVRGASLGAKSNAGVVSYAVIKGNSNPGSPQNGPKKPYGNLRLRVAEFNNGKNISYVGAKQLNFRGHFNSASFVAQATGKVVINIAAVNANGTTKEIVLFNKAVKKGQAYLVNHKPIQSTGLFVITISVTGPKGIKGFNAGALSYAITPKK